MFTAVLADAGCCVSAAKQGVTAITSTSSQSCITHPGVAFLADAAGAVRAAEAGSHGHAQLVPHQKRAAGDGAEGPAAADGHPGG